MKTKDRLNKWRRQLDGKFFLSMNVREGYWIAWFLTMALIGALSYGTRLGFCCGLNLGMGIQKFCGRKLIQMIEKQRRQDYVDLRTMHDLIEHNSYKMLHQMEKSGLN